MRGNISRESMRKELSSTLDSLKEVGLQNQDTAIIIVESLNEVLKKFCNNDEHLIPERSLEDEKALVEKVQQKLKKYVSEKPKIIEYRKLGEKCSLISKIPLPSELKIKVKLMEWFDQYFDKLEPILERIKEGEV